MITISRASQMSSFGKEMGDHSDSEHIWELPDFWAGVKDRRYRLGAEDIQPFEVWSSEVRCWLTQSLHTWNYLLYDLTGYLYTVLCWFPWTGNIKPEKSSLSAANVAWSWCFGNEAMFDPSWETNFIQVILILLSSSYLRLQICSAVCPWAVFPGENLSSLCLFIIMEGVTLLFGGFVGFVFKGSWVTPKVHCNGTLM